MGGDGGFTTTNWPQHPDCDALDVTTNGTVICRLKKSDGGVHWRAHRAGVPDVDHHSDALVVDGDAVWAVSGKSLSGWQSESNGLRLTHSVEAPIPQEPRFANLPPVLTSSGGVPWIYANTRLIAGTPSPDGGVAFTHREFRGPDGGPVGPPTAIAVREQRALMLSCARDLCDAYVATLDGGSPVRMAAGNMHLGTELGFVWTSAPVRIDAFSPEPTGARAAGVVLPPATELYWGAGANVPLLQVGTGKIAVPRVIGAAVVLEAFDPGADFEPVSSASATHAFAWSKDGTRLKLLAR